MVAVQIFNEENLDSVLENVQSQFSLFGFCPAYAKLCPKMLLNGSEVEFINFFIIRLMENGIHFNPQNFILKFSPTTSIQEVHIYTPGNCNFECPFLMHI